MQLDLLIDTETSGKYDFKAPPTAAHQPHLVEVAAQLWARRAGARLGVDPGARLLATLSVIVAPEGYVIPDEAAAVHGITTEQALAEGLPLRWVMELFAPLVEKADRFVAHNVDFDVNVLRTAMHRAGVRVTSMMRQDIYCTMRAMAPICNLPGKYGAKFPTLAEAYRHVMGGQEMTGAHRAGTDLAAMATVYDFLLGREREEAN